MDHSGQPRRTLQPIAEFPAAAARAVKVVMTDIDDTLTDDGQLTAQAYSALQILHQAGLVVVPVTGRPAGWCDMIARFWPVDAVVGENGAFYFRYDRHSRHMNRRYAKTHAERLSDRARLTALGGKITRAVPGAAISADQGYRESDLAIDYCEDVPALSTAEVDRIVALFKEEGATAKVSSIHVNGWFGNYDKLSMSRILLHDAFGIDLDESKDQVVFVGDSPNDAPMFGFFSNAIGVANVLKYRGRIAAEPAWVTASPGGAGFAEVADMLLRAR